MINRWSKITNVGNTNDEIYSKKRRYPDDKKGAETKETSTQAIRWRLVSGNKHLKFPIQSKIRKSDLKKYAMVWQNCKTCRRMESVWGKKNVSKVDRFYVWGTHTPTLVSDGSHALLLSEASTMLRVTFVIYPCSSLQAYLLIFLMG